MSIAPLSPVGLPMTEVHTYGGGKVLGVRIHACMQRVKVYRLTDDGQWDDQGIGHVTIDCIKDSKDFALTVVNEEDNDTLLLHNITSDDIYRKQEETIISWKDPEKALDLALSFQEAEGCSFIWKSMCTIQKNLQSSVLLSQDISCPILEILEASRGKSLVNDELKDLPPLELSSLPSILEIMLKWKTKDPIRVAELISQDCDFFPKLVKLFRTCEGLRNMDGLHMIFNLVKEIILLNNYEMFHNIFSEDIIFDIIGALEYDPEVCNMQPHRAFLWKHVILKEATPIRNPYVVSKIHQTYRIKYIKDIILPRVLDNNTMGTLETIIHGNNALVVCLLKDDASFIQDLFAKMRSSNISVESKRKMVLFLHEFCTLSKSLQPDQQLRLHRDLITKGVFDITSDVLQSQDKVLASAGTNILMHFFDLDPSLVISYIADHEESYQEGNSLLGILVQGMFVDSGEEIRYQDCLRTLLNHSAKTASNCNDVVLQVFFVKHLHTLIDVIASSCPLKGTARSTSGSVGGGTMVEQHSAKPEILLNICELLSFCVIHHTHGIKLNFLTSNSMEKILTLTHRREKVLIVAAVQFMRTIIGRKDESLISHIIKFNLFKPIVEAFVENGHRYNVLHSAVLGLLEFIRNENVKSLIQYVAKSFWDQLVKFEKLDSIQAFKLKYQQIMEDTQTEQSTSLVDMRKKADDRGVDKEEEDYFNKDSDVEDFGTQVTGGQKQSIPSRPKSGGLVDYDDDDEDDKDISPPEKHVKAAAANETLNVALVRSSPDSGRHTDGQSYKRPKLKINLSKVVASVDVTGRHSDLGSSKGVPNAGDRNQNAPETMYSMHKSRGHGNNTSKPTD